MELFGSSGDKYTLSGGLFYGSIDKKTRALGRNLADRYVSGSKIKSVGFSGVDDMIDAVGVDLQMAYRDAKHTFHTNPAVQYVHRKIFDVDRL